MRFAWLSMACAALLGMQCGCGLQDSSADLVVINGQDPETLDPALASGVENLRVVRELFEGLTRLDPQTGQAVPGLAEGWELSEDGLVYTFHLRDDLIWSTGQPLDGRDVYYSWKRVLDPRTGSRYANLMFCIRNAAAYHRGEEESSGSIKDFDSVGIRMIGEHVLEARLESPTPHFLELCAFPTFSVVPRFLIEADPDYWTQTRPLPSCGPYRLDFWRLNDRVRLIKNIHYWDAENTRSGVVDLLACGSSTALNLYESGKADIIWDQDLIPNHLMDLLKERPDFHTFDYLGTFFIRFNVTREPLDDPRVRKAFALSVDKRHIVERIVRGGENPADQFVPQGVANYDPPEGIRFDPNRARALLASAGYPGGSNFPDLEYLFVSSAGGSGAIQKQIAVALQEMWRKELGVAVRLRQQEKKVYFSSQNRLDYDLSSSSWIGDYNDASTFLDLFHSENGNNRTGWSDARYDRWIEEARRETDRDRRAELLRRAESYLTREAFPIAPVYFYSGFVFYRPDAVRGIWSNILDVHPLRAIWKTQSP